MGPFGPPVFLSFLSFLSLLSFLLLSFFVVVLFVFFFKYFFKSVLYFFVVVFYCLFCVSYFFVFFDLFVVVVLFVFFLSFCLFVFLSFCHHYHNHRVHIYYHTNFCSNPTIFQFYHKFYHKFTTNHYHYCHPPTRRFLYLRKIHANVLRGLQRFWGGGKDFATISEQDNMHDSSGNSIFYFLVKTLNKV